MDLRVKIYGETTIGSSWCVDQEFGSLAGMSTQMWIFDQYIIPKCGSLVDMSNPNVDLWPICVVLVKNMDSWLVYHP
jgi:hypothetical protein